MNTKEIQNFQTKLESEKKLLESELESIGRKNPNNAGGWEASPAGMEVDTADENEVADKMEELEENEQIMTQLETQLTEVQNALDRIEKGSYGICEIGGEPIEKERLEANPAARTCKAHMK